MEESTPRTALVVIATYRRPEHVRTCLEHLRAQTASPGRIVVVDASPDTLTRDVVADFEEAEYRRNDLGAGTLAASRAIGVQDAVEDVVAFIDDDAYAEPQWLSELLRPYDDPEVGAVGGRASNGRPGEESVGIDRIGRFLRDGSLTGNFGADPGRVIEADHMLGANMSVRTDALRVIGGIHDYYPGTCLREDADLSLRVRKAGYRVMFAPRAAVLHVAGEYAKGKRFDLRYRFYGGRNHVLLLTTVLGWSDSHVARHLARVVRRALSEAGSGFRGWRRRAGVADSLRGVAGGITRGAVDLWGTAVGLASAIRPVDRAAAVSAQWRRA